ncbi:MAG: dTMP kinase [Pseudomonadota bacterium]
MFITLEGIEGSGKTTQVSRMALFFSQMGYETVVTREPGDTGVGMRIRSILLDPESRGMSSLCELLLYGADRAQHLEDIILPALRAGKVVLCDRFADATRAYQGAARGMDRDLIEKIHAIVVQGLEPDLTLLFDLDPSAGLERTFRDLESGQRDGKESRFEQEKLNFHQRVRAGYLELAAREKERFWIVDASLDPEQVFEQIKKAIRTRLMIP